MKPIYLLAALLLPLCACSCGLLKKKKTDVIERKESNIRLAGRIHAVSDGFVLIRRYGRWAVKEGEVVESRGDGRNANLLQTGEKLGEHIAADIRSGSVEAGDAVYIRRIAKASEPEPFTDDEKKDPPITQQKDSENPSQTP